jgi:hypothetical protein
LKYYFGGNKFVGFEDAARSSKGPGADMIDGVSTDYIDPIYSTNIYNANQAA